MSTEILFTALLENLLGLAGDAPIAGETSRQNAEAQALACRIVTALPYAYDLQPAPPELKARILAAVAEEEQCAHEHAPQHTPHAATRHESSTLFIQRAHEGAWFEPGIPGVAFKKLYSDRATGYATMLVCMQPGTSYPVHRHAGYEECYMLEGEVSSGDLQLFAGDYQRMAGDTFHHALHTKTGCTFLVVASEHNEII